jgi:predicted membrane-bound dolichyl-phosphate-mannose-protein mannosyltransferase
MGLSTRDLLKAIGVGIVTALILSVISVTGMKTGVSPLPKPLALAFAETILSRELPLPVGLAFHTVWVTFFSVVYVARHRYKITFMRALGLSAVLWISTLVVFFPLVGWGLFGLDVSPMLIAGSAVPHLLFAIILWGLCRMAFHDEHAALKHAHG